METETMNGLIEAMAGGFMVIVAFGALVGIIYLLGLPNDHNDDDDYSKFA
tara:strand:- start:26166 stop:26315 length:150 start_codon:yes stop_codon:yes gene_type:complete